MQNVNWSALFSSLITLGSIASVATGHPALGAAISSPDTANALTGIVGGLAALFTAFSPSVIKH